MKMHKYSSEDRRWETLTEKSKLRKQTSTGNLSLYGTISEQKIKFPLGKEPASLTLKEEEHGGACKNDSEDLPRPSMDVSFALNQSKAPQKRLDK